MRGVVRNRVLTLVGIGTVAVSLGMAASASAASIVVTSAADPGGTSSQCTLRQAIDSANSDNTPLASNCTAGSGTDTITFAQSILPAHITLTGGELAPATNMTIQGPDPTDPFQVTVDGNDVTRVFEIIGEDPGGGTPGPTVTMSGLDVTGGHYFYPGPMPQGGAGIAVDFNSILTVDHSAVVDNAAFADINGGGSQQFTIGQVQGGGILSNGTLNVADSTISGNSLNANAIGGMFGTIAVAQGAGIASMPARDLHVVGSTISGNSATATAPTGNGTQTTTSGGGIGVFTQATSVSVIDSTIANNTLNSGTSDSPTEFGGGIATASPMTVTGDTVTGNDALEGANLAVDPNDGSMSLMSTIAAAPVSGTNCARVTSAGHNWSSDASCDPNGTTDFENTDPHLLALGDYGGPTQTRPPAPPNGTDPTVIDQGIVTGQGTHDQRGFVRTVGYDIDNGAGDGTDIGAVEIQEPASLATTPPSPSDNQSPVIHGTSEHNSTVFLFANGSCTPLAAGTASNSAFASPGIAGGGPFAPNTATPFSANATYGTATSNCSSPFTYQVRPALPTLTSTNPASGANNNNPKIIGTATPSSTVNLYTTSDCSGTLAGTGSGTTFGTPGIPVTVADNSATTFYAQATGVGGTSDCTSTGLTYNEVTPPATPTLTSTNPPSGSNNNNPKVIGTADAASTVNLYTTSDCSGTLAGTGSGTTFGTPGIPVTVADNSTTTFYAQATDVGGTSDCSSTGITYVEATPPATPTLTSTNPPSGSDNNTPKLIGTAAAASTVKIYAAAGCTGAIAATGTGAGLSGTGIAVSVPDNSTTTFSAKATGPGGNSGCSGSLSYTEVTPPPAATPTPTPAPTKKKCKKAKKRAAQSAKKKCKKKK